MLSDSFDEARIFADAYHQVLLLILGLGDVTRKFIQRSSLQRNEVADKNLLLVLVPTDQSDVLSD
jgi:hypothetical protein